MLGTAKNSYQKKDGTVIGVSQDFVSNWSPWARDHKPTDSTECTAFITYLFYVEHANIGLVAKDAKLMFRVVPLVLQYEASKCSCTSRL
jgi:hypothetical protein